MTTIYTTTLVAGPFELAEPADGWPYVLATYDLEVDASAGVPDTVGALIAYFRSRTEITAIVPAERIRGKVPKDAQANTFYLVPKKAGGSERVSVPRALPTIDLRCYGPTEYEAMRLFRAVHPCLVPTDRRAWQIVTP